MDISKWPLDKIVQLPDFCFGRRWFVGMIFGKDGPGMDVAVSDEPLPNRMVVWALFCSGRQAEMTSWEITYRLTSNLIETSATIDKLVKVFRGMGHPSFVNEIWSQSGTPVYWRGLRNFVEAQGRRLCMGLTTNDGTGYREFAAGLLISAFPREVPDWVVSGMAVWH